MSAPLAELAARRARSHVPVSSPLSRKVEERVPPRLVVNLVVGKTDVVASPKRVQESGVGRLLFGWRPARRRRRRR
ncbi:MAG: hypothetical protein ACO38Z_10305, partial [Candidatus Nanopelagicales bacterium]